MPIARADRSDPFDDREAIQVGPEAERRRRASLRWAIMLVVYMRALAVLWMVLGLTNWTALLMNLEGRDLPQGIDATVAALAVVDVTAAAGLWLANPWGGVLWLVVAVGEAIAALLVPGFPNGGPLVLGLYAPLVLLYFALTYLASRESELRYGGTPRPLLGWLRSRTGN